MLTMLLELLFLLCLIHIAIWLWTEYQIRKATKYIEQWCLDRSIDRTTADDF